MPLHTNVEKGQLISRDYEVSEQLRLFWLLLAKLNPRQNIWIWRRYTAAGGWWTGRRTALTLPAGCPPSCWSCARWMCFSSPVHGNPIPLILRPPQGNILPAAAEASLVIGGYLKTPKNNFRFWNSIQTEKYWHQKSLIFLPQRRFSSQKKLHGLR